MLYEVITAAYIFEKTTAGWIQTAKLTASDGKGYDYFGVSVSANGDTSYNFV